MKKSFYCLWILLIIMQEFLQYVQTQSLADDDLDPLSMDQARLNLTNQNHPQLVTVKHNSVICEKCSYDILAGPLAEGESATVIIDTKHAHEFQLYIESSNDTISCRERSYKFRESGSYLFTITYTTLGGSACEITTLKDPGWLRYWLPLMIAFSIFFILIASIQLWQCISKNPRFARLLPNAVQSELQTNEFIASLPRSPELVTNDTTDDIINVLMSGNDLSLTGASSRVLVSSKPKANGRPKRLRSLDTFRGFSLMVMVFVNYGGGGYWFFKHSIWNGLTVADVVFPWFTWMMGISIVLSQRSLRARNIRKRTIFLKICRRTAVLFLLGLILQAGWSRFVFIRIFGVLQRLAVCYFFTAILVLIFDDEEDEPYKTQWSTDDDTPRPLRSELRHTLFHFWPQWLFIIMITVAWILITLIPKFENCPRGYLGPGGKHDQGAHENCTGGIAGFIDRTLLRPSHLDDHPTCKDTYNTQVPYDPEGLLGILTGTLLCYLGVQAGHSFAHSTSIGRVCGHWLISGFICGGIGLILSKGGHSDSWIPINKNLWSLSFVLVLAGLAFLILTILYLLVDVYKWFTGEPFLWLGMNSIVIYFGHEACSKSFPIQFQVEETAHAQLLAMHLYGVMVWTIVAGLMYQQKFFVAI